MLICDIYASGHTHCCLLLSTNRRVLTIFDCGVRENIDLQIAIVDSPYMTGDIFTEYLRDRLIPVVESSPRLPSCLNKPVILFCDNYACRCNGEVLKELDQHRLLLVLSPLKR
jgi:hypothetical protein